MSNFVLSKPTSSKPVKTLPQKLLQPTVIAVLASVGIHGALAALLPYMSTSSQPKPAQKAVELVKLTPAELSRIPQPATPPALGINQGQGLNQLPGLSTPYPPLPGLGSLSGLYPTNSPPNGLANVAPSPSTTQKTTTKTSDTSTNKTKPQTDKKDTKITTSTKLALSPSSVRIPIASKRENFSSGGGLPNLNLTAADYAPANPPAPPQTLYPPAPTGNQTTSQAVVPRGQASNPSRSSSPKPEPLPLVSPNIISSNGANNSGIPTSPSQVLTGINPGTAAAPTLPKPQLPPSGIQNGTGTSYDQKLAEGINKLAANSRGADDIKNHGTIVGSYPKDACTSKASGTSNIQAKIDEKGNYVSVEAAPASNPIFDNAAKQAVMNRDLEATNKTVVHMFKVEFSYDASACGSAATPKAAQNTPAKNTPALSNTATPQTAPMGKK
jgi:Gram-negative bacterial TonB protein C-terminal